jgi:amidohydrolase
MIVQQLSPEDFEDLVAWRRSLHRQPELSGEEARTAAEVAAHLGRTGPDRLLTGLGGTGVAAVYEGAAPGPTILLRAELDGLPIEERSGVPYRSAEPGKAHLCGHDGHMASLAAVGRMLGRRRPARGRAVLLFQPAEETGMGAAAVLADPAFAQITPDMAIAYHNLPGLPLGRVSLGTGPVCCASQGLRIRLTGRTSHASNPQAAVSPMGALVALMPAIAALGEGDITDPGFCLATVTHARLGEPTFGVTPGEADLLVTLRALTNARLAALTETVEGLVARAAADGGLSVAISIHDAFDACDNSPEAVACLERALAQEGMAHDDAGLPMRFSEDFGRFGQACPTALVFIGAGETCPVLHSPDYDFPDALIPVASRLFARVLADQLG